MLIWFRYTGVGRNTQRYDIFDREQASISSEPEPHANPSLIFYHCPPMLLVYFLGSVVESVVKLLKPLNPYLWYSFGASAKFLIIYMWSKGSLLSVYQQIHLSFWGSKQIEESHVWSIEKDILCSQCLNQYIPGILWKILFSVPKKAGLLLCSAGLFEEWSEHQA